MLKILAPDGCLMLKNLKKGYNMLAKKIEHYDLETGEILDKKEVQEIHKQEQESRKKILKAKIDNDFENVSYGEICEYRKMIGRSNNTKYYKIDYSKNGGTYFTFKKNRDITKDFNVKTKGVLYDLSQSITHEGFLVADNNHLIRTYKALRDYLNVSRHVWDTIIIEDFEPHNILKKGKVNGNNIIILNPIFSMKSRDISDYVFLNFYKELQEYIDPLDYKTLIKYHGVDPAGTYLAKTKNNIKEVK